MHTLTPYGESLFTRFLQSGIFFSNYYNLELQSVAVTDQGEHPKFTREKWIVSESYFLRLYSVT